ncbi:hypothetical protein BH23PSE1_BH23PSE1_04660 [soil metagenome]
MLLRVPEMGAAAPASGGRCPCPPNGSTGFHMGRMAGRAALLLAGAALAGCTSEGVNPIVGAVVGETASLLRPGRDEGPAEPPRTLTREAIEAMGTAAIRGRALPDGPPTLLLASAANGPYVTYSSTLRQSLTLRASQLTGTRGLGHDLLSATSSGRDPLAQPTPPEAWPSQITRRYEFPAPGPRGRVAEYVCRCSFDETRSSASLTAEYTGVEVSETCAGPQGTFENLHFVEFGTGTVWRSIQWSGPLQGSIDIEIIAPPGAR